MATTPVTPRLRLSSSNSDRAASGRPGTRCFEMLRSAGTDRRREGPVHRVHRATGARFIRQGLRATNGADSTVSSQDPPTM